LGALDIDFPTEWTGGGHKGHARAGDERGWTPHHERIGDRVVVRFFTMRRTVEGWRPLDWMSS
jgi:hypothetical protein